MDDKKDPTFITGEVASSDKVIVGTNVDDDINVKEEKEEEKEEDGNSCS